ncbi:hypothetical protein SPLC1_S033770 [Arthrospira platensis C1]|nr:hypothetical protein SPLC1_S033770 [Arthrospira platensis C1]
MISSGMLVGVADLVGILIAYWVTNQLGLLYSAILIG